MSTATSTLSDGDLVRAFYDAYSDQAPERFAAIVAEDYIDYGHEPPGRGPKGARDDFDQAAKAAGAIRYEIDALVDDGDGRVAAVWTAHIPDLGGREDGHLHPRVRPQQRFPDSSQRRRAADGRVCAPRPPARNRL